MPKVTPTSAKMSTATFTGGSKNATVMITISAFSDAKTTHVVSIDVPYDKENFRSSFKLAQEEFRDRVSQLLKSIDEDDFFPPNWSE